MHDAAILWPPISLHKLCEVNRAVHFIRAVVIELSPLSFLHQLRQSGDGTPAQGFSSCF